MAWTESFGLGRNEAVNLPRGAAFALTTEWGFLGILVGGLAWVPYWYGSDRLVPWGVNALLFPGLAALYELSLIVRRSAHPVGIERIRLAAILFATAATWAFLQNETWIPAAWQHPVWQMASDVLGRSVPGSISVDRSLTAVAVLRLATAASVFWLALQLSREPARARLLMWSVVVITAVYTLLGIYALYFMPKGRVFPEVSEHAAKFVTSTFVNQNHYVTFAGIGLISVIGLTLRIYRRELSQTGDLLRLKIAAIIDTTSKAVLPLTVALVVLVGILLSGVRGGIIATGLGLVALLIMNVRTRTQARSLRYEALLLLIAVLVVGVVFYAFSDAFVRRIGESGFFEQGRLNLFLLTVRLILSAPLLGFGHGTFVAALPMVHDDSLGVWNLWDKAHNTYLETFQGLGLLFGGMLIASVAILVWACLKGARKRQRNATIPAIAASVSFLVGAHALVDFSLQIQAVTLTYMAILGAGVAQAWDESPRANRLAPKNAASLNHWRKRR